MPVIPVYGKFLIKILKQLPTRALMLCNPNFAERNHQHVLHKCKYPFSFSKIRFLHLFAGETNAFSTLLHEMIENNCHFLLLPSISPHWSERHTVMRTPAINYTKIVVSFENAAQLSFKLKTFHILFQPIVEDKRRQTR